jgi:CRISPR/Cas system CSM-associated protein Csm3 (group 7 of RAMP superfamily)
MGQRRYEPEFPKPYDFVPFSQRVDRRQPKGHDSFHLQTLLSGRLHIDVVVQTPVHIGSGNYALSEDLGLQAGFVVKDMLKVRHKGVDKPVIPGATLKGSVRSVVEAVTNSCLVAVPGKIRRKLPNHVQVGCRGPQLCPACGLFGAMGWLARIQFSDALFVAGDANVIRLPSLYRPRPTESYQYVGQDDKLYGRKFYFHGRPQKHEGGFAEALKRGSVLRGMIDFTALSAAELGLLCFGLGLDNSFQLAVGGGKPIAMGRIRIRATELQLQREASFTEYETGDDVLADVGLTTAVTDYIQQAETLIQAEQRAALRQILQPDNPRPAPTGVY